MFQWLRQRKMVGGVVFGAPGWTPSRIESTFEPSSDTAAPEHPPETANVSQATPASVAGFNNQKSRIESREIAPPPFHHLPHNRRDLADLLETLKIGRTSPWIPPLADQLRHLGAGTGDQRPRAIILNLLPMQPEFAMGAAMSRLAMDDLHLGLHALQHILRPRRVTVVYDRHDFTMCRAWRTAARRGVGMPRRHMSLDLRPLLNRYPQGHPTILMRTLLGKRLQVDALPSRFNRLMVDAVTPWALGRHLRTGQAYVDRPVQVFIQESCAEGAPCARLLTGRIGETIADLAGRYQLCIDDREIIINGVMAGAIESPATKLEGDTESISLRARVAPEKPTPCLACGWCVDVCPTALVPVRLMELSTRIPSGADAILAPAPVIPPTGMPPGPVTNLLKSSTAREALHCIGCGLCSYVCPTRLPLTQETLALRCAS